MLSRWSAAFSMESEQHSYFRTLRPLCPQRSKPAAVQAHSPSASFGGLSPPISACYCRSISWKARLRRLLSPSRSIQWARGVRGEEYNRGLKVSQLRHRPGEGFSLRALPISHSCKNATVCETPGFAGYSMLGVEVAVLRPEGPTDGVATADWRRGYWAPRLLGDAANGRPAAAPRPARPSPARRRPLSCRAARRLPGRRRSPASR